MRNGPHRSRKMRRVSDTTARRVSDTLGCGMARKVSDTTIVGYGVGLCWKSKRKNPCLSSSQMRMTASGNTRCVAFNLKICIYSSGNSR